MHARGADAGEDVFEMIADEVPDGGWIQLLRSVIHPALKHCGDTHQRCAGLLEMSVQARQCDRRLAGMFGPAAHGGHQPRPTGNCFAPRFWIGQSNEQTPPVVDQRHCPGGQLAAVQVVRGEATAAPLILEFIESVLSICPVTVKLTQS